MQCFKCLQPIDGESVHGLHKQCFAEWFDVDDDNTKFTLVMKTAGNSNDPKALLNSSFFHGKFKKYSARLNKRGYIIKLNHPPFEELPASEFLCNQLARLLRLKVPDFFFIRLHGVQEAFVSRNFMDYHPDSNLVHLYRTLGERKFTFEDLAAVIYEQTRDYQAVEHFAEICLFDALIGNHDRHGRNLAFIKTSKEAFLSPFYDNPSYLAVEEKWLLQAILEPCGRIHTLASDEPTMADYVIECNRLGYHSLVKDFAARIDLSQIQSTISSSFVCQERKDALFRLITRRFDELNRELHSHVSS